ncbi:MAG: TrmH family RNA methyltransferase [Bacteroidota bacterium]
MTPEQQLTHFETTWEQRKFPLILACDNWHDPLNVGMAFRLADAFGLEAVWLGGTTPVPPNRKIKKTARSTEQWVPFVHQPDLESELLRAREEGYCLLGVEITSASVALDQYCQQGLEQPTVMVLGAENRGIGEGVLAVLDQCVHISMYGRGSSLNVATALGIALYAWTAAWAGES